MSSEVETSRLNCQRVTLQDNGRVALKKRRQAAALQSALSRATTPKVLRVEARLEAPTICCVNHLLAELPVARLDVVQVFGRIAPLHVDLGCGDGSFLCEMAQQFPKRNFLGVERLTKRVEKVRRKAEKAENVRVLRADTLFAVRYLLSESSVETFYLLFPDPWPKRRHQLRRIFTPDFLDAITIALEPHGVLRVATDQLDYFQQVERLSRAHVQFQVVPRSPDDAVLPITKFERKFREEGAPIYRLTLRKTSPVR
jgi:tRNA (guanine-N7-)-methyltransferase